MECRSWFAADNWFFPLCQACQQKPSHPNENEQFDCGFFFYLSICRSIFLFCLLSLLRSSALYWIAFGHLTNPFVQFASMSARYKFRLNSVSGLINNEVCGNLSSLKIIYFFFTLHKILGFKIQWVLLNRDDVRFLRTHFFIFIFIFSCYLEVLSASVYCSSIKPLLLNFFLS